MAFSSAGVRPFLFQIGTLATIGALLGLWPIVRVLLTEDASSLDAFTLAFAIWITSPYVGLFFVASRPRLGLLYRNRCFVMAGFLIALSVAMAWPPVDPFAVIWIPVYQWGIVIFATLLLRKQRRIDEAI